MEINWDNVKVKYVSGLYKINPDYPTLEDFEWKLTFYLVNQKRVNTFTIKEIAKQLEFDEEICRDYCEQLKEKNILKGNKTIEFLGNILVEQK